MLLRAACSIQPWVKPYERDRLADPIMAWDRDAISERLSRSHPRVPRRIARRHRQRGRRLRLQLMQTLSSRVTQAATSARVAALVAAAAAGARHGAAVLPDDRADIFYSKYSGGGMDITGESVLVRKKFAENFAVEANYFIDKVSGASIDVLEPSQRHQGRAQAEEPVARVHAR